MPGHAECQRVQLARRHQGAGRWIGRRHRHHHHPTFPTTAGAYDKTAWDYQRGAWERNDGIRIDHVLLTPQAADSLVAAGVASTVRGREKPSDHVPVWVELDL